MARRQGDTYQLGWFTGMLAQGVAFTDGPRPALKQLGELRPLVDEHLDPVFLEAEVIALLLAGVPQALEEHNRALGDRVIDFGLRGGFILTAHAAAAAELGLAARAAQLIASAHRLFAGSDIYYQSRAHGWLEGVVRWCRGAPAEAAQMMLAAEERALSDQLARAGIRVGASCRPGGCRQAHPAAFHREHRVCRRALDADLIAGSSRLAGRAGGQLLELSRGHAVEDDEPGQPPRGRGGLDPT